MSTIAVLAVAGLAACGGDDTGGGNAATSAPAKAESPAASPPASPTAAVAAPQTINLTAVEAGDKYSFEPSALQAKAGDFTIHFVNPAGNQRAHTFELKKLTADGDVVKSDQVQVGTTLDIKVSVTEAGTYQFMCYQRGHADRGQVGTLVVTRP